LQNNDALLAVQLIAIRGGMFHKRQLTGGDGAIQLAQGPETGPPLLFLHGVGRSWQDFGGLMTSLASRWQVFGIDFRGHGLSARTPGKYFLRDYVRDAVAVARHIGQPLVIYGHSLGAMTAGLAAAELGNDIHGAILEDPPYRLYAPGATDTPFHPLFQVMQQVSGSSESVSALAKRLADVRLPAEGQPDGVRLGDVRDATAIRFGAACLKKVDPELWTPVLSGTWQSGSDYRALLPKITCPVLVLQGAVSLGGMVSDADGDELTRLISDCTLLRWNDVGHLLHTMLPERTLRVVSEFLESIAIDPDNN
jgi:pimeloyl-ACP methyl ester carboxylesterase